VTTRGDFVRLLGASVPLGVLEQGPPLADQRLDAALVLSGGGSRGAYEAGVIAALVDAGGVRDGQPLPGINAVVGTSIGSLNGWFVATGQYGRLAQLWKAIAAEDLFALKRRFQPIVDSSSGLVTRVVDSLVLERGLFKNLKGLFDGDRVARFVERNVALDAPTILPFAFTVTNLSRQQAVVFYRAPAETGWHGRIETVLGHVGGGTLVAREASGPVLAGALRASTAIPVIFDPVEMTFDGVTAQYVDGGIADNTPVDIARILARRVYTVLVDPPTQPTLSYTNVVEIGFASFGVAQRRILEAALRSASLETEGKQLFGNSNGAAERAYLSDVYDSRLFIIRPSNELPVTFADFADQGNIDATYARGYADGRAGWLPYAR